MGVEAGDLARPPVREEACTTWGQYEYAVLGVLGKGPEVPLNLFNRLEHVVERPCKKTDFVFVLRRERDIEIPCRSPLHPRVEDVKRPYQAGSHEQREDEQNEYARGQKNDRKRRAPFMKVLVEIDIICLEDRTRRLARVGEILREPYSLELLVFPPGWTPMSLGAKGAPLFLSVPITVPVMFAYG